MTDPIIYELQVELFYSMSHPTRIQILQILFGGPINVGGIADSSGLGKKTASRHLLILKQKNLFIAQQNSQEIIHSIANPKIFGGVT